MVTPHHLQTICVETCTGNYFQNQLTSRNLISRCWDSLEFFCDIPKTSTLYYFGLEFRITFKLIACGNREYPVTDIPSGMTTSVVLSNCAADGCAENRKSLQIQFYKNSTVQKFAIRSDSFPTETARNPQFKLSDKE